MTPNLHDLANAPGFGTAARALKDAGCWQEVDDESGLPVWRVDIEVTKSGRTYVTVAAESAEEAKRKAKEAIRKDAADFAGSIIDWTLDVEVHWGAPTPSGEMADI